MAKKAVTPKSKHIKQGLVIGDSGTRILSGFIYEEYNPKLQGIKGVEVFDEMRKSDGTVQAAVRACSQPIRSAKWYVEPASADPKDKDIADFIADCLFEHMDITWNDVLRHALLSLPLGVIAFEKVFATTVIDGQTRIVWQKLAPRMPRSFIRWAIGDNEPGIMQWRSDGYTVEIPMSKLVVISNEMEGKNWWGQSILRPAYKHWFIKNTIYKIDAIAHERQGLGVPYVKLPEGANEADVARAETILQNLRANSQAYIIEPFDYDIGFTDMMARTARDPMPSVSHHNFEIAKSVLAGFLELGESGGSGSRALSTDMTELFLQALISVAQDIAGAFNKYAIKELVDLNFDVADYPKLTFTNIQELDGQKLATTYQLLVESGGIKPGVNDEQYWREMIGLPERDPNEEPIDVSQNKQLDSNKPDSNKPDPNEQEPTEQKPANTDDNVDNEEESEEESQHGPQKKEFSEGWKPYRALTFAEQKVDFKGINDKLDGMEGQFKTQALALLLAARDKFMAAFTKAAHDGDTKALKDLELKAEQEYARILNNAARAAFDYGKNNAAREISKPAPASDSTHHIDLQATAIAEQQVAQITNQAKTAYVSEMNKGATTTAALAAADQTASVVINKLVTDTAAILIPSYVNHGRGTVFENNQDDIYALQRSELLDSHTCNYCLSVDGRVVEKDDEFAKSGQFHSNCRGIWVAILSDEQDKPAITGIPQSLRDRFGGNVNDLTQPKTPITRANTLARKEADKRMKK